MQSGTSGKVEPNQAKVGAELEQAREDVTNMKSIGGAVNTTPQDISAAGNPVAPVDSASKFLKSLDKFNSVADKIASV